MEVKEMYLIQLNREEAEALKKILGELSNSSKKESGLNDKMSEMMSDIYEQLPYKEED